MNKVRISASFDPKLKSRITEMAEREHRSESNMLERIVEMFFFKEDAPRRNLEMLMKSSNK